MREITGKCVAGFERMAGQTFLSGYAASAFALDLKQAQRLFSARDDNARFVRLQNFAGLTGAILDYRLPD